MILSHFYLLTGCAGGLWLEGRGIKRFTGVLVLGIGDAMVSSSLFPPSVVAMRVGADGECTGQASIVGKIIGRVRWPGTSKTIEGTIAFISSLVFCAWLLRITSFVEHFSVSPPSPSPPPSAPPRLTRLVETIVVEIHHRSNSLSPPRSDVKSER